MRVYGSKRSYYTGKLEAYLRYKGLAYECLPSTVRRREIRRRVGAVQMPVVERDDGRWMSDSTPILLQLEKEHPDPTILPGDEVVRFAALLLEDYADEWLWRAAMHYRWSYAHDRELLSSFLVDELTAHVPLPRFAKRRLIQRRQRVGFVVRDGVREQTRAHVEAGYFAALDGMTRMLATRPYLLGNAPSLADFGFMGPMLRHFGQDPTPAELMRERAPAVYAWVARVWNAKPGAEAPRFVVAVPADAGPMLQEVCGTHLHQLTANAAAFVSTISSLTACVPRSA
jgi:glutathione S-transferase